MSHHTPIGWNPKPCLNVAAACSFSECALISVAYTSKTVVPPRSAPQSWRQALVAAGSTRGRRTLTLAFATHRNTAGVASSKTRTPPAATRPVQAGRSESAACRCRRSPPARGQRCRYVHSHPATIHRDEPAAGQRCGQPTRSANGRTATAPASGNPCDQEVSFTCEVPSRQQESSSQQVRSFPTCKVLSPFYITRVSADQA